MIITLPFKVFGFIGITIYPFIFITRGYRTPEVVTHERIHLRQQCEHYLVGFFAIYLFDYVKNRLISGMNHRQAYLNIRFEVEARGER